MITLRQQRLTAGKMSLYLDIYPPIPHPKTGKPTRRQFLGLHIWENPSNKAEKAHNKTTLDKAILLRMEKEKELENLTEAGKMGVLDFAESLVATYKGASQEVWRAAVKYLAYFLEEQKLAHVHFYELTYKQCLAYRTFLLHTQHSFKRKQGISPNSRALYFATFQTLLRKAFEEELLKENIADKLKGIPTKETAREFLTLDELKKLAQTPCSNETLKTAALFSALTGLRFSDIEKMTWAEVREDGDKYSLHFRQQKTQHITVHPIGRQAFQLLGTRQTDTARVFPTLAYSAMINRQVAHWAKAAGIAKKITFHSFRHTFATLQLEAGTDLYTVSKLLGHAHIQTTQIYAKVVDKSKRAAVERIDLGQELA